MSNLYLREIRLHNFMSYSDLVLPLPNNNKPILLLGKNGSGKSTLLEAIYWCLYGDVMRVSDKDGVLSNFDPNNCNVTLVFDYDMGCTKADFIVSRYKKHKKYGANYLNVVIGDSSYSFNKLVDGQQFIDGLLGNKLVFLNVAMFGQGMNKFFANSRLVSEEERKRILADVLNLVDFEALRSISSSKVSELKSAKAELDINISKLRAIISECLSILKVNKDESKVILESLVERRNKLKRDIETKSRRLQELRRDIEVKERRVSVILESIRASVDKINGILSNMLGKRFMLEQGLSELSDTYQTYKSYLEDPKSHLSGNRCPTCFRVYDDTTLSVFVDHCNTLIAKVTGEIESLRVKLATLTEQYTELQQIKSRLSEKAKVVEEAIYKDRQILVDHESKLNELKFALNSVEEELTRLADSKVLTSALNRVKESKIELGRDIKELSHVNDQLLLYDFWVDGFSDRGLKNMIFASVLPYFNSRINYYLDLFSGGVLSVQVNVVSFTKSEKLVDRISVTIYKSGVLQSYDNCSGGERRRIDTAVMFALRDLALSSAISSRRLWLNLLCLDEVLDWLDTEGIASISEYLVMLARNNRVFVVGHSDDLRNYFTEVFHVEKDPDTGYSRVYKSE